LSDVCVAVGFVDLLRDLTLGLEIMGSDVAGRACTAGDAAAPRLRGDAIAPLIVGSLGSVAFLRALAIGLD